MFTTAEAELLLPGEGMLEHLLLSLDSPTPQRLNFNTTDDGFQPVVLWLGPDCGHVVSVRGRL